jgi:hypothetical protein
MPGQSDPAKEPSGPWEGWRNDPIVKPAAPSTEHGPWENYAPQKSVGGDGQGFSGGLPAGWSVEVH